MNLAKSFKYILLALSILILMYAIYLQLDSPSNDRMWQPQLVRAARIEINDNQAIINNVRIATYESTGKVESVTYENRQYNLNTLQTLDYFVTPFGGKGVAHTILSFGFGDDVATRQYIALSVEARKEVGEEYGLVSGMLNEYEIQYIWADEYDVIRTRAEDRNEATYWYALDNVDQQNLTKLFLELSNRTNELIQEPEFYHTIWNNCTIDLWQQVNQALPDRLPWTWTAIFPEKSGEYLADQGLMSVLEQSRLLVDRKVPTVGSTDSLDNYSRIIRDTEVN